MNKLSLSVSHHLFLSREQRYSIHNKEPVETIGASIPVWFYKGTTSEPAEEIFCRYILVNEGKKCILSDLEGYTINLPSIPDDWERPELSNDEWRTMSQKQKEKWYEKYKRPESSLDLLDLQDGGGKQLIFTVRHLRKMKGHQTLITHTVIIKDEVELLETLTGNLATQSTF